MTAGPPEPTGGEDVVVTVRDGWEVLQLRSAQLLVEVLPGLGATVTSVRRAADGLELLWHPPWGLVDAAARPRHPEAALAADVTGGWSTLAPEASDGTAGHGLETGAESEARVARYRWRRSGSSVLCTARLLRTPLEVTRIVSLRRGEVTVGETVRNLAAQPHPLTWANQVVLGGPLVGPGMTVDVPAAVVRADPRVALDAAYDDLLPWPRGYSGGGLVNLSRHPPAGERESRFGYLADLDRPRARVSNAAAGVAVDLAWDGGAWPHLWYSLETGLRTGFPWYGAAHFLALTPSSSWPARPVAEVRRTSGSAVVLGPGVARTAFLSLTVHSAGGA